MIGILGTEYNYTEYGSPPFVALLQRESYQSATLTMTPTSPMPALDDPEPVSRFSWDSSIMPPQGPAAEIRRGASLAFLVGLLHLSAAGASGGNQGMGDSFQRVRQEDGEAQFRQLTLNDEEPVSRFSWDSSIMPPSGQRRKSRNGRLFSFFKEFAKKMVKPGGFKASSFTMSVQSLRAQASRPRVLRKICLFGKTGGPVSISLV